MADLETFLRDPGLVRYLQAFRDNDIDATAIDLQESHLRQHMWVPEILADAEDDGSGVLGEVKFHVAGPVARPAQLQMATVLEDPVENGLGQIGIVEDPAPGPEGFLGRDDHGLVMQAALVDDVEEHVGGIGP